MGPISAQIWAPKTFFEFYLQKILYIVASYHCMQFQEKLEKIVQKLISGLIVTHLAQIWLPNFFRRFFLHQILGTLASYHCILFRGKLMFQTQENGKKLKKPAGSKFELPNFFKNVAPSLTRYHGQSSSCTISEKTNDSILRKFSDGWTDRQTDRQTEKQTDKSDFIGRSLTLSTQQQNH